MCPPLLCVYLCHYCAHTKKYNYKHPRHKRVNKQIGNTRLCRVPDTLTCTSLEGSSTIGPAVLSGVDVHVRASAHLFHGSCKSGDIVYLCDSGICICASAAFPPPSILEGGLASQTQSFLFLRLQREWNRGKSVSKAGRRWAGKRPKSLGCPGELPFPPRSGAGAAARAAGGGERWVASSHLAREGHYTGVGALGQSEQPRGKDGGVGSGARFCSNRSIPAPA